MKQKQFETEWKKYKLELEKIRKELEAGRNKVIDPTYNKKADQNEKKQVVHTDIQTAGEN